MPRKKLPDEVRGWFAKAANDLKNIELVLPSPDCPFDTVCFHAQHAAEKYIKGFLTLRGIDFPKTHDLEGLTALLPQPGFPNLDRDELDNLTLLSVVPRYPGREDEIDRDVAEEAFHLAVAVKASVLEEIEREGFDL